MARFDVSYQISDTQIYIDPPDPCPSWRDMARTCLCTGEGVKARDIVRTLHSCDPASAWFVVVG